MTRRQILDRISRLEKKKRRRMALLGIVLSAGLLAAGYGAMGLYREYLAYSSLYRTERHDMAALDAPACLHIVLEYPESVPAGIQVVDADTGRPVRGAAVYDDPEAKSVHVLFDAGPDDVPGSFALECRPMEAKSLRYSCEVEPSYRHIDGAVAFCRDGEGHMWACLRASYGRALDDRGVRASIRLDGPGYAPRLYDGWIHQDPDGDKALCLDVTRLAEAAGADRARTSRVVAELSAEYEPYGYEPGNGPSHARLDASAELKKFPEDGPPAWAELSDGATEGYIAEHMAPKR